MRGTAVRPGLAAGLTAALVAGWSIAPSDARADMLSEALAPRAVGAGEALSAASHGSISRTLNPAGVGLSRAYVIEGTFGFRASDDARIGSASICDSTRRVAMCLSYD